MRQSITILISFFALTLHAQINYTASDLASVGDSVPILKMSFYDHPIHIDDIDENGWDFSAIIPETNDTAIIFSSDDLTGTDNFPEGTMFLQEDDEVFLGTKLYGDTLKMVGFLVDMGGDQLLPIVFEEPIITLVFPLSVGFVYEATESLEIAGTPEDFNMDTLQVDSIKFVVEMTGSMNVESTGTLSTFRYDLEAFKIIETNILAMDLYVKVPYVGWFLVEDNLVSDSTKSFRFFNPNYGIPLCEVNMNWNDTVMSFKMVDDYSEFIGNLATNSVAVYPNPVTDNIIAFSETVSCIMIYNLQGQKVLHHENETKGIDLSALPHGIYMVTYKTQTSAFESQKIIID
jgi:hypothetical protein